MLNTTEISFPTDLEARCPKTRGQQNYIPAEGSREKILLPPLSQLLQTFLSCVCIILISASILTWDVTFTLFSISVSNLSLLSFQRMLAIGFKWQP